MLQTQKHLRNTVLGLLGGTINVSETGLSRTKPRGPSFCPSIPGVIAAIYYMQVLGQAGGKSGLVCDHTSIDVAFGLPQALLYESLDAQFVRVLKGPVLASSGSRVIYAEVRLPACFGWASPCWPKSRQILPR